ncbi:hypothetical protein ACEWY4_022718 [Coilia grayii]|uniref:Uncharacterized protein n=1 Tax=Coilia grayii TaxID=363190 RepID=A0ABD1J3L2_9TELE
MFRKINNVFRPNNGQRHRAGHRTREDDYHSACTVKLVRSTSMLVVGETQSRRTQDSDATLKRSKSSVNLESSTALYYYQIREDQLWLYSQNENCLRYLQELMALRRQYTQSVINFQNAERRQSLTTTKKKPAPKPPRSRATQVGYGFGADMTATGASEPSAPPIPNEEDTLQFFDDVIASFDPEPSRKPNVDDGHADVDFIVATSTSEHDLHSNWVLRDPRRFSTNDPRLHGPEPREERGPDPAGRRKGKGKSGASSSTSSGRRLQRNPIHLPKVVESAFQTLRFKPKLKKKD